MANEKNLVPFDERTESEQREIASAGGKASGKARRRKKNLKQKMQLLLSLPAADNDQAELSAMGVDPEDMDNEMVLVKALFLAAADWARARGAGKLYISAHSAAESQAFYRAMGCVEAQAYMRHHVEAEPFDCQLEYGL